MLYENKKFLEFKRQLEDHGVHIRFSWAVKKNRYHSPNDLHFACFYGTGFAPGIICAIIVDYGKDLGFGLFTDDAAEMAVDIKRIAGKAGIRWKQDREDGHAAGARAMSEEMCGPL